MVDPILFQDALERVQTALDTDDLDAAVAYLLSLHPADSAEMLAELEPDQQAAILDRIEAEDLAEVFEQLDEEDMADVAGHLDTETLADVLDEMEPDMAADLLGELEPEQAAELIEQMDEPEEVTNLLSFDPDTAGGIMNAPPPSLRRFWTVDEAIRFIKDQYRDETQFYYLYVLDRYGHLIGVVSLRALILAEAQQSIEEIMDSNVISVHAEADQEEVAQLLQRYDLVALPVVDEAGKLIGIVHVDDVVDVIEEEATEDIYKLAQVSADSEIYSRIPTVGAQPAALADHQPGYGVSGGLGGLAVRKHHCAGCRAGRLHAYRSRARWQRRHADDDHHRALAGTQGNRAQADVVGAVA